MNAPNGAQGVLNMMARLEEDAAADELFGEFLFVSQSVCQSVSQSAVAGSMDVIRTASPSYFYSTRLSAGSSSPGARAIWSGTSLRFMASSRLRRRRQAQVLQTGNLRLGLFYGRLRPATLCGYSGLG